MKKKSILFITSLLSLPLLIGGGLSSYKSFNNVSYYKVDASVNEKKIYIDLSDIDDFINPYLEIDKGSNGVEDISLTHIDNSIYVTDEDILVDIFSSNSYRFIILSNGSDKSTSYVYGGEDNLLSKATYNYISFNSDSSIKGYGNYGSRVEAPSEATYKTQRVWLYVEDLTKFSSSEPAISYYEDNKYNIVSMKYITNTMDARRYYYVDIPYSISSIRFLNISNVINHNYIVYREDKIDYLTYGTCYYYGNIEISTTGVTDADAGMLARVTEAYLTYGKDDSNGTTQSTVQALFRTWFKNKAATTDELKNTMILDYTGYAKNGNKYDGLEKNQYFSVNEKWNTMCSQAGIDPKTGEIRGVDFLSWLKANKVVIIIVSVAVIGVAGFTTFLIIKKKKKEK